MIKLSSAKMSKDEVSYFYVFQSTSLTFSWLLDFVLCLVKPCPIWSYKQKLTHGFCSLKNMSFWSITFEQCVGHLEWVNVAHLTPGHIPSGSQIEALKIKPRKCYRKESLNSFIALQLAKPFYYNAKSKSH